MRCCNPFVMRCCGPPIRESGLNCIITVRVSKSWLAHSGWYLTLQEKFHARKPSDIECTSVLTKKKVIIYIYIYIYIKECTIVNETKQYRRKFSWKEFETEFKRAWLQITQWHKRTTCTFQSTHTRNFASQVKIGLNSVPFTLIDSELPYGPCILCPRKWKSAVK